MVAHADRMKKQPELVKKFSRASLRSMAYMRENRSETSQMIMREFAMDQEIAALACNQLLDLLSPEGRPRLEAVQLMVDFARAVQKLDRPLSASQLVDGTLLDEVLRDGSARR